MKLLLNPLESRLSPELIDAFRELPVTNVSDVMESTAIGGRRLFPLHRGGALCGNALTVRAQPSDNLVVHAALNMATAGDVIVIDAGGDLTYAMVGELTLAYAQHKKLGGIVVNGAVRDVASVRSMALPVYAAGVTFRNATKEKAGQVNIPILIHGVTINPGDLILGDEDGFICVPANTAANVHREAQQKFESERTQRAKVEAGSFDRRWVEAALQKLHQAEAIEAR